MCCRRLMVFWVSSTSTPRVNSLLSTRKLSVEQARNAAGLAGGFGRFGSTLITSHYLLIDGTTLSISLERFVFSTSRQAHAPCDMLHTDKELQWPESLRLAIHRENVRRRVRAERRILTLSPVPTISGLDVLDPVMCLDSAMHSRSNVAI